MIGALINHISTEKSDPKSNFQPMPPNFGLLPELEKRISNKRSRYIAYRDRALEEIKATQPPMKTSISNGVIQK